MLINLPLLQTKYQHSRMNHPEHYCNLQHHYLSPEEKANIICIASYISL